MKRKIFAFGAAILVFAIVSFGTLAYFSVTDRVENMITAGSVDLVLHQTDADGNLVDGAIEVMPGDSTVDIMTIENTGDHPLWVRVLLTKQVNGTELSADCMSLDINTTEWTYSEGYYYYNTALSAGETTVPLFTEVRIDGESVGVEYIGKTFTFGIDVYGVQSENNGATVWDAIGWSHD